MNVVCVYSVEDAICLEKPLSSATDIPFGISIIATVLKEEGHNVRLLVFSPITPIEEMIKSCVYDFQPRLFCITTVATQFPLVKQIAETVKKIDSTVFISIGGCHPSLKPEEVIAHPAVDAICIGEGENAVVELAAQLEKGQHPSRISNLWIKTGKDHIEKYGPSRFIEELDKIPYIDRKMWKPWIAAPENMSSVLIGRGCPNRCTFCSNHKLSRLTKGKYVRFRSPENIIGEIRGILKDSPGISRIYFEVETLGAKRDFIFQLADALVVFNSERRKPIVFGANFAVTDKLINNQLLLRKLLSKLRKSNFEFLNVGLESGSERIRNEILRRPKYSNENIIMFCDLARQHSINIYMNVMMGLPDESYDDFKETIRIVRRCQPKQISLAIFYPYPGTDLHSLSENMSLISRKTTKKERKIPVLSLPNFSAFQIKRENLLFYFRVYKGHRPLFNLLGHILWQALSNVPRLSYFLRRLVFRIKQLLNRYVVATKSPT